MKLSFLDVSFAYPGQPSLLKDISLDLISEPDAGRVIALMGGSGSGKTTLLLLLAGVLAPSQGSIIRKPESIRLSLLPQEPFLLPNLDAGDNARLLSKIRAQKEFFSSERLESTMEILGIAELCNQGRSIDSLSGGQRQKVALARALSIQPHVLLLDEPCAGLDSVVRNNFLLHLRRLVDESGTLAVYVTHHSDEVQLIADEVVYVGKRVEEPLRILSQSRVSDVLANPVDQNIASSFRGVEQNVVDVRIRDNFLFLGSEEVCAANVDVSGNYKGKAVFSPSVVRYGSSGFFKVTISARSDRYWFLSVENVDFHLIGRPSPAVRGASTLCSLDGEILFFNGRHEAVFKLSASSTHALSI